MNMAFVFFQHIDKVFKHKELQQQLVDAKLQRTAELMREVDEKQQRERMFVSVLVIILILFLSLLLILKYWQIYNMWIKHSHLSQWKGSCLLTEGF